MSDNQWGSPGGLAKEKVTGRRAVNVWEPVVQSRWTSKLAGG